jgi:hypothetical protein
MKIPLSEQIAALEYIALADDAELQAALSTLKWVERHQAELRVLGEFPIEKIEVLTPQATGLSAIGSADAVKPPRNPDAPCPVCGDRSLYTDFYDQCYACGRNIEKGANASATADKASAVSEPVNTEFLEPYVVRRDEE